MTDTLLLSLATVPTGLRIDATNIAGKAALYSAGFLLREAAARQLDVQGRELRVGLWLEPQQGGPGDTESRGWMFLADALENGAGYCTHLGQQSELGELIASAQQYVCELQEKPDHRRCDSSCYGCLRSYENQSFHALLDWRLARDWLDLATNRPLDTARWADHERGVADSFGQAFQLAPVELDGGVWACPVEERLVLVSHPLEDPRESHRTDRLILATIDAEDRGIIPEGGTIECRSSFDLLRRPGSVFAGL